VNEYKLKIEWRVYERDEDGQHVVQSLEKTFACTVVGGQLQIPADALRIIHKRAGSLGTKSVEWVGEKPPVFKCGALSEEEAALLSQKANAEADLAMRLLEETEPEAAPTIKDLIGGNGAVRVIGEADYENDVPLLQPNRWGDNE